jgi:hypothetical protein
MKYATRIWGKDGLEYTGDVYKTKLQAIKGVRWEIKQLIKAGLAGADWTVFEWTDTGYGEVIASSDQ